MYKLQWTKIKIDGNYINPKNYEYHDLEGEYNSYDQAMQNRIILMSISNPDIYIKIEKL